VAKPTLGFGLLHDFRQKVPHSHASSSYYAECLAQIEEAEALGYQTVWLSEHHFTWDGFLPSPLVVAAAAACRTSRIRIGTNIVPLALHHPLRVAEDAAVVDLLSGGRLVLGVGQGYAAHEFEAFGIQRRLRPSLFEEGVTVIRKAWEEGSIGFNGTRWRLPDLPFGPRPGGRIPVYVGAVSEQAIDRAVRIADGLLVYCATPGDFAERYGLLQQVLTDRGKDQSDFPFVATGIVHVDEDADRAWDQAAPAIAYLEGAIAGYAAGRDQPPAGPPRPEGLRREDLLVGTPNQVAERLIALHRQAPYDHPQTAKPGYSPPAGPPRVAPQPAALPGTLARMPTRRTAARSLPPVVAWPGVSGRSPSRSSTSWERSRAATSSSWAAARRNGRSLWSRLARGQSGLTCPSASSSMPVSSWPKRAWRCRSAAPARRPVRLQPRLADPGDVLADRRPTGR
jgi:alkanesulfonate monooxygenase SsuD/methylene tetrahydromethanopterin reductase-like flavin-dependent oxidoreductase (luciferase family)